VGDDDGTGVELAIANAPVRLKRIVQRELLDIRRDQAGRKSETTWRSSFPSAN
jgi:hypothetical protein